MHGLENFEPMVLKPCIAPQIPQVMAKILTSKARNSIMDISDNLNNTMMRTGGV